MEIRHIKLDEVESTQTWLKENVSKHLGENLLVSTASQTAGVGRMGNSWSQYGKSLAFSLTIKPTEPITLTPLELGVHLVNYFKSQDQNIFLKWPNDILIKENGNLKKVGGIICNYVSSNLLIVGIGINIDPEKMPKESSFKFEPGAIAIDSNHNVVHDTPNEIYSYILNNRISAEEIKSSWIKSCCHHNLNVKIADDKNQSEGLFTGLGTNGEALIKSRDEELKVVSGSLWILD